MGLFQWADRRVKAQNIWDVGVLKLFCMIVGMVLGAYLSVFVIQYLWWFIIFGTIFFIYLAIRFFTVKV